MRHHIIEGASPFMDAEEGRAVIETRKADEETRDGERQDEADGKPVSREEPGERAGPRIGRIGLRPHARQGQRHVDVEFMRRGELAIVKAGAAAVAEVGQIIEIAVSEGAAHLHRRKYRAEPLAIAAGIADRHEAIGLGEIFARVRPDGAKLSSVHRLRPPAPRCARRRCRSSCRCRRRSRARAHCRP